MMTLDEIETQLAVNQALLDDFIAQLVDPTMPSPPQERLDEIFKRLDAVDAALQARERAQTKAPSSAGYPACAVARERV